MHMTTTGQHGLPASSRALADLILAALDRPRPVPLGGNTGLPAGALDLRGQTFPPPYRQSDMSFAAFRSRRLTAS